MKCVPKLILATIAAVQTLALAGPSTAPTTAPAATQPVSALPKAEQLFADGRDALYRRDYNKAIELLTAAAAEDKTKTGYRLYLARRCAMPAAISRPSRCSWKSSRPRPTTSRPASSSARFTPRRRTSKASSRPLSRS